MNKDANRVEETIAERGKVYGDPYESHKNIGKSWGALLSQHFGRELEIPASLVAQMMVCFKMQRSARVFKEDNYVDAIAYTQFAEDFQQREQGVLPEEFYLLRAKPKVVEETNETK